jgi:hypothetical protein
VRRIDTPEFTVVWDEAARAYVASCWTGPGCTEYSTESDDPVMALYCLVRHVEDEQAARPKLRVLEGEK